MEQHRRASDPTRSPRRHFHVPARELLLPTQEPCLFLPSLTLDGLAITPAGAHHLILSMPGDRMYFGPDEQTVDRRAQLTAKALHDGVSGLDSDHADAVHLWVMLAWDSMLDELVDALAAPSLNQL